MQCRHSQPVINEEGYSQGANNGGEGYGIWPPKFRFDPLASKEEGKRMFKRSTK